MSVRTAIWRFSFLRGLPFLEASTTQRCWRSDYTGQEPYPDDKSDVRRQKSPRKHLSPLLKQELGLKRHDIIEFFKSGALELDKKVIMERLSLLRKMGFDDEEIKTELSLLLVPQELILSRKGVLEECGVTEVTTTLLARYEGVVRTRTALLKASGLIPQNLDVSGHILSYAGADVPPVNFSAAGGNSANGDSWTLMEVHRFATLHYLVWFFNDEKMYRMKKLQPLSFRRMLAVLDVLQSEISFDKEQLRANLYLIHCDPQKLSRLLRKYPNLGDDIRNLIKKYPKLALRSTAEVEAAHHCLKGWGFDDKTIGSYPSILTLSVEELNERLSLLKQIPEVWSLRYNQSILKLLDEKDLILKLQYIKALPRRMVPTVHLLSSADAGFRRSLERDKQVAYVRDYLRLLAAEFNVDTDIVKKLLSRHPLWKLGSSAKIMETLTFLRSRGYSGKDILDNLPIVLYPRSYVENVLDTEVIAACVGEKYTGNSSVDAVELRLCLYYMEKNHAFSGQGILEEAADSAKGMSKIAS